VERQTRNNAVAGVPVLVGAAFMGFGATRPWADGTVTIPAGFLAGLTPGKSPGFDFLLMPGGSYGDVRPLILGASVVTGLAAIFLSVTRARGLGVLWRLLALPGVLGMGALAASTWSVVNNPASVIADPDSPLGRLVEGGLAGLETIGLANVKPGLGLWLLTVGCGIAAIGLLIPAVRHSTYVPDAGGTPATAGPPATAGAPVSAHGWPAVAPVSGAPHGRVPLPAGWYPDQSDASLVRWYNGVHWTEFTQRRA
jgi:hypothetical protein